MSILWFQLLLNLVFCYWLYVSLRTKWRLGQLEDRLYNLDLHLREIGSGSRRIVQRSEPTVLDVSSADDSGKEPGLVENLQKDKELVGMASTLSEKLIEKRPDYLDVYAEAAQRLARGEALKSISSGTGLSLSELRLVEKIAAASSENTTT